MKVRDEINRYAKEENKPILNWLFDKYHMQSQWSFVARCTFDRFGTAYFQANRVCAPTAEGRILYAFAHPEEES
jgi:hypothetical protein